MRERPDRIARAWTRRIPARWRIPILIAAIMPVAAFLFAWGGFYSVAASRGHWPIIEWALHFVMTNSVETHAWLVGKAPPLDDPNLKILGAGHFYTSCAPCHGGPGQKANAANQSMLPPPPDLSDDATHWKDAELFWIVQNGIKYTGMPAWAAVNRHDEIWAVVAFLKELPTLDAQSYRALALGNVDAEAIADRTIATCTSCHGGSNSLPRSRLVPILHGQPAAYLAQALRDYADGTRHSGFMQPIATDLPPGSINRMARHYAGLRQPPAQDAPASAHDLSAGERLAKEGDLRNAIPPCLSCHGADALETYPRLAGQYAPYMETQLRRYREGKTGTTGGAAIMRPIAERLTDQQIRDLAAYFAGTRAGAVSR